jgi:hypothetical protein
MAWYPYPRVSVRRVVVRVGVGIGSSVSSGRARARDTSTRRARVIGRSMLAYDAGRSWTR